MDASEKACAAGLSHPSDWEPAMPVSPRLLSLFLLSGVSSSQIKQLTANIRTWGAWGGGGRGREMRRVFFRADKRRAF